MLYTLLISYPILGGFMKALIISGILGLLAVNAVGSIIESAKASVNNRAAVVERALNQAGA